MRLLFNLKRDIASNTVTRSIAALVLLSAASMSNAIPMVEFALEDLGGDMFRYNYTIHNDHSIDTVVEINTFFDPVLYDTTSLGNETAPGRWLPFVDDLSDPAIYQAVDFSMDPSSGVPPMTSLSGFSVDFLWLGSGLPGAQPFELLTTNFLDPLIQGMTTTTAVPLPPAIFLLGSALGMGAIRVRKRSE